MKNSSLIKDVSVSIVVKRDLQCIENNVNEYPYIIHYNNMCLSIKFIKIKTDQVSLR